jgi:hypothetical protein
MPFSISGMEKGVLETVFGYPKTTIGCPDVTLGYPEMIPGCLAATGRTAPTR